VAINQLNCSIDLEGLAHHRGSAFGGHGRSGQPTPATFENTLACAALTLHANYLVLEDESRTIGRLALPETWHARMQRSPLVLIEASMASRVSHIAFEYVTEPINAGEDPWLLSQQYRDALGRIRKRLGGLRYQRIEQAITDAFAGKIEHAVWIEALLREYYDPMYDYQLQAKQSRIVMRGTRAEVTSFLANA
jgi:tRNA 2-selenouridine synthase